MHGMRRVADVEPQTLKEILQDSARYRWVMENLVKFYYDMGPDWGASRADIERLIDAELATENE